MHARRLSHLTFALLVCARPVAAEVVVVLNSNDHNVSLIDSLWFAPLALVIGIPPAQFVAAVLITNFVESLAHANVHLSFGTIGNRPLVSSSYHQVHHAIGIGHEGPARGCNFATQFPVWDSLFGSAEYRPLYPPTGVRDQLTGAHLWVGCLVATDHRRPPASPSRWRPAIQPGSTGSQQ